MKNFILSLFVCFLFLSPGISFAQTMNPQVASQENLNFQLIVALKQVIALLIKQVAFLTAQLQEQQKNLGAVFENPTFVPVPILPTNIESSTNKNIQEGVLYPSVKLQVYVSRKRLYPIHGNWYDEEKINGNSAVITSDDKIRMLFSVGNPDKDFVPDFFCSKTGDWAGVIEPYDHWEEDVKISRDSVFGVMCSAPNYTSQDSFNFSIK